MLDRLGMILHYQCAMNKLSTARRAKILRLLCEGCSLRSISRAEDVALNTVTKLLISAGVACAIYHDENIIGVKASRVQCDEVWSFIGVKAKNRPKSGRATDPTAGDVWTWTAIEADTKLLVSYMVGGRDAEFALILMDDLRRRLANRVQLTTDGHAPYLRAVDEAFGADIDYAMLVKLYGEPPTSPEASRRYSPSECVGTRKEKITGNPDPKYVSTSYAERHNLTMRMAMRRFTRLTNAFSKKIENHYHAVALHVMFYNYIRQHASLNKWTPAIAAGLTDRLWSFEDIVRLIDERAGPPKKRGPYQAASTQDDRGLGGRVYTIPKEVKPMEVTFPKCRATIEVTVTHRSPTRFGVNDWSNLETSCQEWKDPANADAKARGSCKTMDRAILDAIEIGGPADNR